MAKIDSKKFELDGGYSGYVNATRAQVYRGPTFLGQTDRNGVAVQVMPSVDRATVEEQGRALLVAAGVLRPAPASLHTVARAAEPPEVELTAGQRATIDLEMQIADLEDRAQEAEDREQLGKASSLRAKARALRAAAPSPRSEPAPAPTGRVQYSAAVDAVVYGDDAAAANLDRDGWLRLAVAALDQSGVPAANWPRELERAFHALSVERSER